MDPTSPDNETPIQESNQEVETSGDSNQAGHSAALQARFNELTGQTKAQQEQIQKLIEQNAELARLAAQRANQVEPVNQEPPLPEGVDQNLAAFIKRTVESAINPIAQQNQQMFAQVLSRQDMQMIESEYSGVDPEVKQEASRVYAIMKKKYPDANLEDAMDKAYMIVQRRRAATSNQRAEFNSMPGVVRTGQQVARPPNRPALIPPTQDPNWNTYDWRKQAKLIEEYEKKAGPLTF